VIGERDRRDVECLRHDALAVEDEVELLARPAARVRRQAGDICALEPRGLHEEVDLVLAPERIEVSGDDHGLRLAPHELVQVAKLVVPVAKRNI